MLTTMAPLLRGIAIGAFLVIALGVWRSTLSRDAKLTTVLTFLSSAAWALTGSEQSATLLDHPRLLLWMTFPAAGLFWAFVACVFQDRPLRGLAYAPAALLLLLGIAATWAPPGPDRVLLAVFNLAAAGLCLHAMVLIVRSWRGDLVDSRRSSRGLILGIAALFAATQGAAGALHGLGGGGPWASVAVGEAFGAVAISALALAMGGLLLEARTPLFATPAPQTKSADARLVAADRVLLTKLEAFMDGGGWRTEGLSIPALAQELGTQEHRLRRLINSRLQHRNFADFVNGYRVAAAKAQLADPAHAEATIASLAFDLGFGSLSPFNRAFRAATGATPTAWRRAALAAQIAPDGD
ncbi:MAG: helix-turn-helix domain-containing protein [Phenylobacterium sp.]|uniref:AraC family transcriptional regulator n=1 Tax=Phenylobacterium sp. TaxID=1871053 RepID=UPI002731147F|nr:helix-turn-helix domain-containing protein [Phenylobacterium sp.]MDP2012007.1 helix-turn-helix domain-containing protein [Phenylobacterium sp.]MDP3635083.1 helix-turn-helix domain-containing protein [Phenylobacterium sp.]MDZ4054062.1 helix-turn-helix domain-containing protein [Phenylobacterium sp.]